MRALAALGKATQGLFALVGTSLAGKSRDEASGKQFMGELRLRRHGQEAVCRILGELVEECYAVVVGNGKAADSHYMVFLRYELIFLPLYSYIPRILYNFAVLKT